MKPLKPTENKNLITKTIDKHGHCAEHNFYHYKYCEGDGEKCIYFNIGKNKGILATHDEKNNVFYLFPSGVLAPPKERYQLFYKMMDYAFDKYKIDKVCVEVNKDFRKEIKKKIKNDNKYYACKYYEILYWPMYNLKKFDPKLAGKKYKKLRNIRNRFYDAHKVKILNSKKLSKKRLLNILDSWLSKRNANDRVDKYYYENMINENFKGIDHARTIVVDGIPSSITAGWKVPNTNNYYSHIGILDYSVKGLGEVANIHDLQLLKKKGYDHADFGGSDKVLLYFKKKFKPESIYKTYIFSIMKQEKC